MSKRHPKPVVPTCLPANLGDAMRRGAVAARRDAVKGSAKHRQAAEQRTKTLLERLKEQLGIA